MDRQKQEDKLQQQATRTRTIYSYVMGILWSGTGFFLLTKTNGLSAATGYDPLVLRFLGGMFLLYGMFRAWRGYKIGRNNQG